MGKKRQGIRCRARKSNGEPCRNYAITGGVVCRVHGGGAPQVKAAAERRVERHRVEKRVARELAHLEGVPEEIEPAAGLANRIVSAASWALLFERAAWGLVDDAGVEGLVVRDAAGNLRPHVVLDLVGEWSDRLARYAKFGLELGLHDQELRLAQQQGELIAQMLVGIIEHPDLGLSERQRRLARELMAQELRTVAADASESFLAEDIEAGDQ